MTATAQRRMGRDERTLVLGALLNAMAFFAALPFAALYLDDRTSLSPAAIGAVVGAIPLIAALGGLGGGALTDRFGAVRLIRLGLALNVAVYCALAATSSPVGIVALFLLLGAARTLVEPSMKKLLSLVDGGDGRIFRVRYITLCVGAIVGPAIGGVLYSLSPAAFFLVPAGFFALYLFLVAVRGGRLARLDAPDPAAGRVPVGTALRDRRLLAAIGAGGAVFLVFSQMDTVIPLYMRGFLGDRTEYLFAALLVTNAVLALAVQPLVIRWSERVGPGVLTVAGCANFAVAFVLFWISPVHVSLLFAAVVFWTLGEAVLLPLPDIAVHTLASADRKGTYFGLSELRYLGFFVGPALGGWLLEAAVPVYFGVMAVAVFPAVVLLARARRA
ncbi:MULTISPECIES: MFS transporter [unclassified Nocardiopsis]|uniref:MFS transporter n=1 Tax=Nocardiopsis TaxID=2013 RepID=UPI00387AC80A